MEITCHSPYLALLNASYHIYFSSKFPAMTRSSSHDSIMDALSGSPKSEDSPEAKLEKEVSKMSLYLRSFKA